MTTALIQQSLDSGSVLVQILLFLLQKFATVRISDSSPSWKQGLTSSFASEPLCKNNLSSLSSSQLFLVADAKGIHTV